MLKHVLLQPCTFGGTIPWYEPSDNARNVLDQFPDFTFSHLEYEAYAWPGGYEISYLVKDGGVLCHQCANAELMRTLDPDGVYTAYLAALEYDCLNLLDP